MFVFSIVASLVVLVCVVLFVFNILILSVSEWICVFLWEEWSKIGQKPTSILYVCECVFSVHVTDYFSACDCVLYCESVLVCWVRNLMYSLAGNSARVRISFVFVYYRYDFLTTGKKTRKNSHLLSFKWFWRSQFYSKVVLVIRFRVCFYVTVAVSLLRVTRGFASSAVSCWGDISCQNFGLFWTKQSKHFKN